MTRILSLIFAVFAITVLTGCNTMQGFGRDVERTGQEIEEAAD